MRARARVRVRTKVRVLFGCTRMYARITMAGVHVMYVKKR